MELWAALSGTKVSVVLVAARADRVVAILLAPQVNQLPLLCLLLEVLLVIVLAACCGVAAAFIGLAAADDGCGRRTGRAAAAIARDGKHRLRQPQVQQGLKGM